MNTPKLPPLPHWCESGSPFAEQMQAYATAATEPLLQRIVELEQRNRDLYEDVQRFRKHAMNEKAARMELERQLEETLPDQTRYLVGDLTLEQVFKQAGLTNLCDLQAVLDQMEKVLLVSHEAQNQKAATAPQKPLTDEHRQELVLTLMAAKLKPSGSVPVHCAAFIALCAAHNIGEKK